MLKLNLILNGLVSSLDHAIQGDTLLAPYHKSDDGQSLRQFDYVVSNPPFKTDFSDTRNEIANRYSERFWAGIPTIPKVQKESMAVYTCFIQHVVNSLNHNGKGAIVVPAGFLDAKNGVERKVLKRLVDDHIVYGAIKIPANVFANTPTSVAILFFDNTRTTNEVVLIDASKLGEEYKDGNIKKCRLLDDEIDRIIHVFNYKEAIDKFSVVVPIDDIKNKNYTLNAGKYFDMKVEYIEITQEEFTDQMVKFKTELQLLFDENNALQTDIFKQLEKVLLEQKR
ncbi:MAG: SAM-dependent methyltransferase, partial [Bacteroidales bacterium]|nr:SAM-dependent methyltransferase [Bacteroidales bacterium]